MITLTATARCLACDWTAEGNPDKVDRAAEKHASSGHSVVTRTEPVPA